MSNEELAEKLETIENIMDGLLKNLVKVTFRCEGQIIAHFDTFAQPAFRENEKLSVTRYFNDKGGSASAADNRTENKTYTIDKIFREISVHEEDGRSRSYLSFDILLK